MLWVVFFLAQMGTVVAVGVPMFFCFCSAGRLLANGGTTDGYVPFERWVCKKCDRKKQQKGWLRGRRQKDCASPERFILSEGRGFLTAGGKVLGLL